MDLPVIDPPVFPRWVWIEEIAYSHIIIATLITAFMVLAPIFEYIGFRRKDPRLERLARSLIWFAMILFSPGAALGTGIPMWIIGTYPEFWSRWANLFFWPLILQFIFFLLEVGFLFFGYYLTWDVLKNRKRLHILLGAIAAAFGLLVQLVWDATGAYMLTPGAPLPHIDNPVTWSAQAFFNPSFPFLFFHRFVGNISYSMLLVGGVFALKGMKDPESDDAKYFRWASRLTFALGFAAFFAMPLIGWGYARVIQREAPIAFHAIMGGHTGPYLTIKMVLVAAMVIIGAIYLCSLARKRAVTLAIAAGLVLLYIMFLVHPPLDWLPGGPIVWRIACTAAFVAFGLVLWYMGTRTNPESKVWRWAKFSAGMAAMFAFLIGGFIREHCKNPYTVYNEIVKPEVKPVESDRFLVYSKCIACHHATPGALSAYTVTDWKAAVDRERQRPGVELTDAEAKRIIAYLEEFGL